MHLSFFFLTHLVWVTPGNVTSSSETLARTRTRLDARHDRRAELRLRALERPGEVAQPLRVGQVPVRRDERLAHRVHVALVVLGAELRANADAGGHSELVVRDERRLLAR